MILGKEGPMLHGGSILAVIFGSSNWFKQKMDVASHWGTYTYNRDLRDLVACGAACGVCTAFKAPVGGVLFSMEMSTRWRKELTWRCFLVSAITIVVVRYSTTVCLSRGHCTNLGWGSLAWFQQAYPTPYGQTWAFVLLAIVGGYIASLFTAFNTWVCLLRKRWSKWFSFRILEVCVISVITSIVLFAMPLGGRCHKCDTDTLDHCVVGASRFMTFAGYGCSSGSYNDLAVLVFNPQGFKIQALFAAPSGTFHMSSLLLYSAFYYFLAAITYGAFIPSGLFTVSLIFGGCFGRIWAELLVWVGAIDASEPGLVGIYALLGAASFLGGLMRMSASMCLVLMEMTGAPNTLPFLMMVLIISKGVGDRFNYSVFDHQIMLKGFAFIGGIPEHIVKRAHLDAEDVMLKPSGANHLNITEPAKHLLETLDANKTVTVFAVCGAPKSSDEPGDFMGIISRQSILELVARHGDDAESIDLSSKVEVAPVVIPPGMPLTFIYNVMQEQGLNYIPVIRQHGPLEGMVSRVDIVGVQSHQLDKFHVKENLQQASKDIEGGRIIQSMMIDKQTAALRKAIAAPFMKARDLLVKDIHEHDEFMDGEKEERTPIIYLDALAGAFPEQKPEAALTQQISLSSTQPYLRRSKTDAAATMTSTAASAADGGVREQARVHSSCDRLE
eukprot:GHUV01011381.1.p1 GENE.GHUV01011381.1~~GHUV01011381.1.p1  ORF type:complete len:670 (+),score=126.18 GHUV01011381.1:946-2955(+)